MTSLPLQNVHQAIGLQQVAKRVSFARQGGADLLILDLWRLDIGL